MPGPKIALKTVYCDLKSVPWKSMCAVWIKNVCTLYIHCKSIHFIVHVLYVFFINPYIYKNCMLNNFYSLINACCEDNFLMRYNLQKHNFFLIPNYYSTHNILWQCFFVICFRVFGNRIRWLRCKITSSNENYTFVEKDWSDKSTTRGSPTSKRKNISVSWCTLWMHFR